MKKVFWGRSNPLRYPADRKKPTAYRYSTAKAGRRVAAFFIGGLFLFASVMTGCSLPASASGAIIVDDSNLYLFDEIPQHYIDIVKTRLLIAGGESHGGAYLRGPELLEQEDYRFAVSTNDDGGNLAAEDYREDALRINRAFRSGSGDTWEQSCGEEDFWVTQSARDDYYDGLAAIRSEYSGEIYALFGWCSDLSKDLHRSSADPVFGCRWGGQSVAVDDETSLGPWGLDDGDNALTGNSVNLNTYLEAVERYNTSGVTTIYTTGPVDFYESGDDGYQTWLKHEAIREHVRENGGILIDWADILSRGRSHPESWEGHTWYSEDPSLAVGDGSDQYEGTHTSEEGVMRIGKAVWVALALDAGWSP